MQPATGDRVALQPGRIHALPRTGTVEAVLGGAKTRYQVRWDDGKWSIIAPTDGALRVVTSRTRRRRTTAPKAGTVGRSTAGG